MARFSASKGELVAALSKAAATAGKNEISKVVTYAKVTITSDSVEFFTTNVQTSARVVVTTVDPVKESNAGEFCVPAKDLLDRVKLMPDGEVTVELKGDRVTIKAKGTKRRFFLSTMSTEAFPMFPSKSELRWSFETNATALLNLIGKVQHAISDRAEQQLLNCMLLKVTANEGLTVAATDGHRLACSSMAQELDSDTVYAVLPKRGVTEACKLILESGLETITLKATKRHMFVVGPGFELAILLYDGLFVQYEYSIPKSTSYEFLVGREDIVSALKAVSVSDERAVFEFAGSELSLCAEGELSESIDSISVENVHGSEDLKIAMSSKYMRDAVMNCDTERISISTNGQLDPVMIREDGYDAFTAIVMPMRL